MICMVTDLIHHIHSDLKRKSNSERKEKIAGYLKTSSLQFIGVELPDIHRIVQTRIKDVTTDDKPLLMDGLWNIETFETRLAAIDVMKVYAKKGLIDNAMKIADQWVDEADALWNQVEF